MIGIIPIFHNNEKKKKKEKKIYNTNQYYNTAKPYNQRGSRISEVCGCSELLPISQASPSPPDPILWVRKNTAVSTGQGTTLYHREWQDSCLFPIS